MPITVIMVQGVAVVDVAGGLKQFTVTGAEYESVNPKCWQFQTLDMWQAAVCKRAEERDRPLRVLWKDGSPKRWGGRFPRVIVEAELVS